MTRLREREMTRTEINRAFAVAAERRLGRPLTDGERRIDVVGVLAAMEHGKERLARAIVREQRRVADRVEAGHSLEDMAVTDEMVAALNWLHELGMREARRELRAAGVEPPPVVPRAYAEPRGAVRRLVDRLTRHLPQITVRVQRRTIELTLAQEAHAEVLRAAARIPGALDAASQVVSSAFLGGMGEVFGTAADLISGWTYSAVLDGGTCDPCAEADGTEYASWEDAQTDMPDGGPNPDCDGEGRCRCRLVPNGAA